MPSHGCKTLWPINSLFCPMINSKVWVDLWQLALSRWRMMRLFLCDILKFLKGFWQTNNVEPSETGCIFLIFKDPYGGLLSRSMIHHLCRYYKLLLMHLEQISSTFSYTNQHEQTFIHMHIFLCNILLMLVMLLKMPISSYDIWWPCFDAQHWCFYAQPMLDDLHRVNPRVIVSHDWIRCTSFLWRCRKALYYHKELSSFMNSCHSRPRQKLWKIIAWKCSRFNSIFV